MATAIESVNRVHCPQHTFFTQILKYLFKNSLLAVNYSTFPLNLRHCSKSPSDESNVLRGLFIWTVIVWDETKLLIQVLFLYFLIETRSHCLF